MKNTKKLTVSASVVALSAVFMGIGSFVEMFDLTAACLASVLAAFIYIEIGSPYTWLVWVCTSLLTALLFSGSLMWVMYLFVFGLYPMVKGYTERLSRPFWLPIKLAFANLSMTLMLLVCNFVLKTPFLDADSFFGLPTVAVYILFYALLNVAFLLYDYFITVMVRFYMGRIKPKIRHLLK